MNFDDDSDDGDFNGKSTQNGGKKDPLLKLFYCRVESIFFSACFGGGKLGVAFYHTSTLTLSIVNDVIDWVGQPIIA